MIRFIPLLLLFVECAFAQHYAQPHLTSEPFVAILRIEDVTDSTEILELPARSALTRIVMFIDSTMADVNQISIGVRGNSTDELALISSFPEGDGVFVTFHDLAGSGLKPQGPDYLDRWYYTSIAHTCVLHVTTAPGGTAVGQIRIYFFLHQF